MLCEDSAEIKRVVITDDCRNLRYVIIRALQQADSVIDSNVQDVLHRRLAGHLFEITQEPADTHITGNSIFFNVFSSMVEKNNVFQKRDPRAMENHGSPPREGT